MNRLDQINSQFTPNTSKTLISQETITINGKQVPEVLDHQSNKQTKLDFYNLQGWGYKDSGFLADKKNLSIKIMGNRYMFAGQTLPGFYPFVQNALGLTLDFEMPKVDPQDIQVTPPFINHEFVEALGDQNFSRRSFNKLERCHHSHGQTF